ncbi:hypothetical protein [Halovenus salina]|uniref:Uncharacterized protein n=1 Tax=Halovenus salina TaxID=1510225 RepID=A0ABD5VVP3_9EURY|nr:hypothetical protein [Halovenus salina]
MSNDELSLHETSLTERVVLLAITEAEMHDETPVASVDIRSRCLELVEQTETEQVSTPGESDIMRALSVLGTEPYTDEQQHGQSPTGKGRPQYALSVAPETVLDTLADDSRLVDTIDIVRGSA